MNSKDLQDMINQEKEDRKVARHRAKVNWAKAIKRGLGGRKMYDGNNKY